MMNDRIQKPGVDPGLSRVESLLARVLSIDQRLDNPNTLIGVRRTLFRGSLLERAVSSLILSLLFGAALPVAIVFMLTQAPDDHSSFGSTLKEIYLFASKWIFDDIGNFISLSLALMTAGLTAAVAVAAMNRAKYNADLENRMYLGGFSQIFNLAASIFFAFHLLLCTGWIWWREDAGGNISIFAPEVAVIGWVLTLLLASITIGDISVLKQKRSGLITQRTRLERQLDPRLQYRPLPLFNIINLAASLSTLLIVVINAAMLLAVPSISVVHPVKFALLLFAIAIALSLTTSWVFFVFTPRASPFSITNRFLDACRFIGFTVLCVVLGTISAGIWAENSLLFSISAAAQIVIVSITPAMVSRSTIGTSRLRLSSNNMLLERQRSLSNAIALIDEKTAEVRADYEP